MIRETVHIPIYYSKFDRDHVLMEHKILTNDLIESKIETKPGPGILFTESEN